MKAPHSSAATSRLIVVAIVTALLQLGAAGSFAHYDDHCSDGCFPTQCGMAAGNGCASPCTHFSMQSVAQTALDAFGMPVAGTGEISRHGIRRPERPFRPPALT